MKIKFLTIVSGLCLLAATGGIASAESTNSETNEELSPAIMKVLCQNFPLNSQCSGAASQDSAEAAPVEAETSTAELETSEAETSELETPETETSELETPEAETSEAETETPSDASAAEGTVVEVASTNGSFKTLVAAIEAADLVETLSGEGPFTVFAPSDEAFAALPPGAVDALLLPENKDKLVKILTYHVVPAKAISSELESGDVTTVAGEPVNVSVSEGTVTVNNASVIEADVMGSNGVIHVIDKVLLPPNLLK